MDENKQFEGTEDEPLEREAQADEAAEAEAESTEGAAEAEAESPEDAAEAEPEGSDGCPEDGEEPGAGEAEGSEDENGSADGKASFFRRKEKKDRRDEEIEALNDRLKRNLAEFENFRKRSEREKAQMYDMGVRSVVEKLLPVIDNFERGISMRPEEEITPFAEGMDKVYKQFTDILEQMDVKPIIAVGQQFDPNFHNAVMQDTESDYEPGTIVEEFQKGYMLHDTVIRYSMVKVRS